MGMGDNSVEKVYKDKEKKPRLALFFDL